MNPQNITSEDDCWDHGWDEHKSRQLRRQAGLTFAEKLEWLEQAQELGEKLIAQSKRPKSREAKE